MLISFTYKKHPLYNSPFKEKNVIYSCVPITYNKCSYLLTLFDNLEGVLLDEEIIVSIYINKKRKIIKTIRNIKDLHKNNIDTNDSFYDTHTSLLFINFQDISIEYIELDSYNISSLLMQEYKNENVQIYYFNNYLDTITSTGTIIDNYNYDSLDIGFILPPIPHLQCLLQCELKPLSGSPVYNSNNQLYGILSHSPYDDCRLYKIIPTILIIKSLEKNRNIYIFNESTIFTNIVYSSPVKEEKGLYIVENSNTTKKLKKGYIITSINGCSIITSDTLLINTNSINTNSINTSSINTNSINTSSINTINNLIIPINTYIWLLSLEQITINKIKTCNMEDILQNYAENNDDSINIIIHQNNKKYVNKVKLYNVCEPSFKVYEPIYTKFKGGYILDANEHIIKLLKLNRTNITVITDITNRTDRTDRTDRIDNNDILLYLWNNRFNEKANKKLYFKKNKVQLLPCPN
jgi:hypothetical protein